MLPRGFLDAFLAAAEAAQLQPRPARPPPARRTPRGRSRAAGPTPRARRRFVEIGPLTAFARPPFDALLPFPAQLRMGWGLDVHWSAVARERGWRIGIVDATPIAPHPRPARRRLRPRGAVAEARAFLATRPYVPRDEVRTLAVHP